MSLEAPSPWHKFDWHPSRRKLKQFAFCLVSVLLIFAWSTGGVWRWSLLASAGLVACLGWSRPESLKLLAIFLTLVTFPIGLIVGELALLIIYGGVFLPIGLCFRLMRRDALKRQLDRHAASYWEDSAPEPPKTSYLRRY